MDFSKIIQQMRDIFVKMSPIQRTNFFLLVAIVVVFLVFIGLWAGKTDYTLLYSNLAQKDAAQIKTKLDELGVEHKVDGNAIYVDPKLVHETRLQLADEGLPQGSGVGYELFGKPGFVMTDYMQKLNYKRALEGELSRTISALNGIRQARVHLAIPKRSLFRDKENVPTASVVLDVGASFPRTKEKMGGVVHLVASSVEGLLPENVTVVDSRGTLLSGLYEENSQLGLTTRQSEITRAAESHLKQKAETMLTAILGHGSAIVQINADMNFDIVESTEEKYDPESAVARTETRSEEVFAEKDNTATAEVETAASTGKSKDRSKEKMTTSYEINRSLKKMVGSTGTIKRLSVAVVVEGSYKEVKDDKGKMNKEYVARSEAEKDMYKKLVMNAVGFDKERGDTIQVADAAFDTSYFEEESAALDAAESKTFILNLVRQISVVVVLVVIFFLLFSMMRRGTVPSLKMASTGGFAPGAMPAPSMAAAAYEGMTVAEAEGHHEAGPGRAAPTPSRARQHEPEYEEDEEIYRLNIRKRHPRAVVEEEMRDMVMEDPDTVAQLVRMWLDEEEI